jgi:hypothetical protein
VFTRKHFLSPTKRLGARRAGLVAAIATALVVIPLGPLGASAGAAPVAAGGCNGAPVSQPFARWGDANDYELVPGGDFEGSLEGWTLSGRATTVAGSEPYDATGTPGYYSLSLPAGSVAQSPNLCVNASDPTFRFFTRNNGLLSTVLVQAVYQNGLASVITTLGVVALSGNWQPSATMFTASLPASLLSGGSAQVALRFTSLTGASQIDDVFLDPRMR